MRKKKRNPVRTSRPEREYQRALTQVARQVGMIISGFPPGDPEAYPTIERILRQYSDTLHDWAIATASRMIADVNQQDRKAWVLRAQDMAKALRDEILNADTGVAMRGLLAEQVTLIKSLPLEAAKRVHELTLKGIEDSTRASEISQEILRSGEVSASRAMLIARTEVSRTAATLTEARAKAVGSEGYIWRTSHDGAVRESHKEMEGKFVPWSSPPTLDKLTGHAGCLPNCRCWPSPVIPE
ncbi:phage putative head morphogenesis protein, SPP1 gp7 family [Azotobacter beijerinckii]|uniref:Phage putative head morphogenesis protein, SPP1 gp7 family n=1 Tax=Azotobacter beijerinckii TaxID=170623 RepID=A0A1H6VEN2_9GAMM|nr:phage minor head protein [Azotobacter beijerinckii]SEI98742.1 phage putative head morphogenesis protein, SPP1 gp7 family [Azotobacter beijerinckii]